MQTSHVNSYMHLALTLVGSVLSEDNLLEAPLTFLKVSPLSLLVHALPGSFPRRLTAP